MLVITIAIRVYICIIIIRGCRGLNDNPLKRKANKMNIQQKHIIKMCLNYPDHIFKTWPNDIDHCESVCALNNLGIVEILPQYDDIRFRLKSAQKAKQFLEAQS